MTQDRAGRRIEPSGRVRRGTAASKAIVAQIVIFVSLLTAWPGVTPHAAVFGADDRVPVPPSLRRQQDALGVLFNIRSRSVCTAFCVGEQLIVTAGHCLFKTRGEEPPRLEDFWFARNYDEVRDYARIFGHTTRGAAQNVAAGSTRLSVAPPIDATSDWAIVRLNKAICTKGVFEVEPIGADDIAAASKQGKVSQLAYHRDLKSWRPAWSRPCAVSKDYAAATWGNISADFSNPEALLLHTCDTGGASSGSPLLMETARGLKVVGVNVGTYVQSKVIMSGAQTVQRLKPETVANTGVTASAFHETLQAMRTASILATRASVRELQSALAKSGHYKGPLDGTYGDALKAAIMSFEAAERLRPTGIASEAILLRARAATKR